MEAGGEMTKLLHHLRFLAKKPLVAPRLVKDLFDVRIMGKNRLRTIDWQTTMRCDCHCSFCSAHKLMAASRRRGQVELTPTEIEHVCCQATKLGVIHHGITGGEPTMREDLLDVIAALDPRHNLVSIVTNSKSMSYTALVRYKEAGVDTIQLSLESMFASIHDDVRRSPGNWAKLMQVLDWAISLKLNVCLSTVLTADNFAQAQMIADFAKSKGVFCLLNPVSQSGANSGGTVARGISDMKDEYYKLLNSGGHIRADTVTLFRGSGCPAGRERIAITPFGQVLTCPHVQVSYGNVRDEPLAAIYERMCNDPWLCKAKKDCRHVFDPAYVEARMKPTWGVDDLPVPIETLEKAQ
jgi:MoaA/NifB/PqqE/SkfB family radical SAM enzyme